MVAQAALQVAEGLQDRSRHAGLGRGLREGSTGARPDCVGWAGSALRGGGEEQRDPGGEEAGEPGVRSHQPSIHCCFITDAVPAEPRTCSTAEARSLIDLTVLAGDKRNPPCELENHRRLGHPHLECRNVPKSYCSPEVEGQ